MNVSVSFCDLHQRDKRPSHAQLATIIKTASASEDVGSMDILQQVWARRCVMGKRPTNVPRYRSDITAARLCHCSPSDRLTTFNLDVSWVQRLTTALCCIFDARVIVCV